MNHTIRRKDDDMRKQALMLIAIGLVLLYLELLALLLEVMGVIRGCGEANKH